MSGALTAKVPGCTAAVPTAETCLRRGRASSKGCGTLSVQLNSADRNSCLGIDMVILVRT
jgi:hypothetical protein